jgi:uncharacterized membrane protein
MNLVVDLNSDLGEGAGHDNEILDLVSSANIACGYHAGDAASIFATIKAALKRGVSLGAHPSFPDRENFGRTEMNLPPEEVYSAIAYQIGAFHGLGNVVVVGLFAVSWLTRYAVPAATGNWSIVLSGLGVALALVTGWLGGELVDRMGVGIDDNAHLNAPSSLTHGAVEPGEGGRSLA